MQNTRLIKFLKSLDYNEINQFRDFIVSPSFNKNKFIIQLFEILYQHYPGYNSPELAEEKLFKLIFSNEKFQYFKIKNLVSDLFSLGKDFLAFNVYKKDKSIKEKFLLSELRKRNLDTSFEQAYKYAEKQVEKIKAKDENYFFRKMEIQFELTSYYSPKKPNVNFHYLQERLDLFVNYSVITLLKMYNIMLHENNQNNFRYDMKLFDNVMEYLEENDIRNSPVLEVYYNILLLEKTKDEKYFFVLKELKIKYKNELSVFDNYMIYLHMDGFCATAFNNNCRTDLLKEQFLLAKDNSMIDTPELGKILYPDFLNEIKKAVRVNEFEWAENYIERFKSKLTGEKENTLNFCYGYISYKKGELEKALEYFSKANFSNFIIKVQVKILLLQLNYEMGYFDQTLLMIDAFRHYLSREKSILDSIKLSILKFLKICGDLIKIKSDIPFKDRDFKIAKIKQEIENMNSNRFGIKLWLKEITGEKI